MKLVITFILMSLVAIVWVQDNIIKRVKLVEDHTNICGETLKTHQYQIDVITDLIRQK